MASFPVNVDVCKFTDRCHIRLGFYESIVERALLTTGPEVFPMVIPADVVKVIQTHGLGLLREIVDTLVPDESLAVEQIDESEVCLGDRLLMWTHGPWSTAHVTGMNPPDTYGYRLVKLARPFVLDNGDTGVEHYSIFLKPGRKVWRFINQ